MEPGQIALQLYTVRDQARLDFPATLAEVARIGYRAVELAGYHGLSVQALRSELDDNRLQAVAAHVSYNELETRAAEALDELGELGCRFAVLPSLPRHLHTADAAADVARTLNAWGAVCSGAGIRFAFHNHAFEIETRAPTGETFLDRLAASTDAALVSFELDVYWAHAGGADPVEVLALYAGRIPLLHIKDMTRDGADAPFGEGILPWPELLAAARRAGVEWYVIEQDDPEDPLRDAETSLRNALQIG